MMDKVEEFAYDPTAGDRLIFQIQSYALKKALSKRITDKYMGTGIFTEFQRQSPETIVKKSKSFKQINFLRDVLPMDAKMEPAAGQDSPTRHDPT